ncbi:MAG: zinc-ribbon domain-containing protein [Clostridia bacterium]|nr:zinc-ribbon domain-containing protein [Clostridia bacterium]
MYCTNCGTNLADDAIFCTNCGAKQESGSVPFEEAVLGTEAVVSDPAPEMAEYIPETIPASETYDEIPAPRSKRGVVKLIIALVLGVAIIATGVLAFFATRDPKGSWKVEEVYEIYDGEENKVDHEIFLTRIEITKDEMIGYDESDDEKETVDIEIKDGKIANADNEDLFYNISWKGFSMVLTMEEEDWGEKFVLSREWTLNFIVKMCIYAGIFVLLVVSLIIVLVTKGKKTVDEAVSYETTTYEPVSYEPPATTPMYDPAAYEPPATTPTYDPAAYEPPAYDPAAYVPPTYEPSVPPAPAASEPRVISTMRRPRPTDGHTSAGAKEESGGFFKSAGDL